MVQRDNWGWRARFGMFIVGSEAVPEAEWWAMLPPDVSVHAARITARAPWASWDEAREQVELSDDLHHGASQFASMRLQAVVLGHSSSSIAGGEGWDAAVISRLSEVIPAGVVITTNGLDCVAALHALAVQRPFVVFPPWFSDDLVGAGQGYVSAQDLEPAGFLRQDPGLGWRDIAASDLYANGAGFEQDVESLYAQIRASCPAEADGVLIAGTGLRCVGIIDALEEDLGRPVVSANQASLWRCLRLSGIGTSVSGYGRLLRHP